jgi:hypothetical protein
LCPQLVVFGDFRLLAFQGYLAIDLVIRQLPLGLRLIRLHAAMTVHTRIRAMTVAITAFILCLCWFTTATLLTKPTHPLMKLTAVTAAIAVAAATTIAATAAMADCYVFVTPTP